MDIKVYQYQEGYGLGMVASGFPVVEMLRHQQWHMGMAVKYLNTQ